ncbi:tRNA adenosine(34) deaminase TadA [Klugiella xanthotipulae]|uniref:tRNA-specific adenosine deaminase n=1 Tax=Klugiella xanthotipulae TaxID=244735 RepID=A0A543I6E8_9MICO|nr:tRNA adenosine(34) deaminase TadA [Klugiella xanthotipulae]TQM66121.1 tRNA(adenine34) deaminase [Klugiella xanthotipulae]
MSHTAGLAVSDQHREWMRAALAEARRTEATDDVPIGALVYDASGRVIGRGHNTRHDAVDPTAHAEVLAIRAAAQERGDRILTDCTLVVTLEPCVMCAGAIAAARVPTVVFGAWDEKAGAVGSVYDVLRDRRLPHRSEVVAGVEEAACAALLVEFFERRRGR